MERIEYKCERIKVRERELGEIFVVTETWVCPKDGSMIVRRSDVVRILPPRRGKGPKRVCPWWSLAKLSHPE